MPIIGQDNAIHFVSEVIGLLRRYNLMKFDPQLNEVTHQIESWSEELGIEKSWDSDLHPADILDKYVFPEIRDRLQKSKNDNSQTISFSKPLTFDFSKAVSFSLPKPIEPVSFDLTGISFTPIISPNLLPCPKCKSTNLSSKIGLGKDKYFVICNGCLYKGPKGDNEIQSEKKWNNIKRKSE